MAHDDIPLELAQHISLEWRRRESLEQSRHRTDFESLQHLGVGAFGVCQKVKNRVDGQIYCLKSILIPDTDEASKVLREVQVLSSIKSDHVVRYYSAWVEKGVRNLPAEGNNNLDYLYTGSDSSSTQQQHVDPTCHLCRSSYKDWEVSFEHWGLVDSVLQPMDLCVPCYKKSIPDAVDTSNIAIRQKQPFRDYLFILMEYCESTLKEAVVSQSMETIWNFFGQCVQGVQHLHAQGVIHRDIKPSNIFVHNGVVKIGDLGLATIIGKAIDLDDGGILSSAENQSKSSDVGTSLYTAPEVATGSYDEKCDIYSLGVLLVEIFSSFGTAMERAKVLGPVELPREWVDSHPLQAQLASQMTTADPSQRPSCSQILLELMQHDLWKQRTSLECLVADLSDEVVELRCRLKESQLETLRLRRLLDEHNIDYSGK